MAKMEVNCSYDLSEHDSSRRSSGASNQTKATTLKYSVEADQVVPDRSSPVQYQAIEGCSEACSNAKLDHADAAIEITDQKGKQGLEQAFSPRSDHGSVRDGASAGLDSPDSFFVQEIERMRMKIQELIQNHGEENRRKDEEMQSIIRSKDEIIQSKDEIIQNKDEEIQLRDTVINDLSGKVESHESKQNSPYDKFFCKTSSDASQF